MEKLESKVMPRLDKKIVVPVREVAKGKVLPNADEQCSVQSGFLRIVFSHPVLNVSTAMTDVEEIAINL